MSTPIKTLREEVAEEVKRASANSERTRRAARASSDESEELKRTARTVRQSHSRLIVKDK